MFPLLNNIQKQTLMLVGSWIISILRLQLKIIFMIHFRSIVAQQHNLISTIGWWLKYICIIGWQLKIIPLWNGNTIGWQSKFITIYKQQLKQSTTSILNQKSFLFLDGDKKMIYVEKWWLKFITIIRWWPNGNSTFDGNQQASP